MRKRPAAMRSLSRSRFLLPRVAADGDPWAAIDDDRQVLDPLLAMHERDMAAGLMDAPWPPVYPKQPNEPPRVAPSRARTDP